MTLLLTLTLACSGGTDTGDSADDTGQSTTTTTTTTDDTGETEAVDLDKDGVPADMDCDDEDPDVHYGNDEICDDKDNDCNGVVDDTYALDATTWYLDADGDDRGVDDIRTYSCTEPEGYASAGGDCNDLEATIYPGADEVCDDTDQDCDDRVDEDAVGDGATWYADYDEDGFGTPDYVRETCAQPDGYVDNDEDCDDQDSDAWPGSVEVCDGGDDDCDGEVDEDNSADASTYYIDYDGDGYGSDAYTISACELPDGWSETQDDCDDVEADVHPGADEFCNDIDDNCDGQTDENGAVDPETFYLDSDSDGHGDPSVTTEACEAPLGYTTDATDCDDGDATSYPGATEVCDSADNDCNGETDEDSASDAPTWYADSDGDGDGDPASSTASCSQPTDYVGTDTDCDDTDPGAYAGATETCDGVDNNCDGTTDEDSSVDALTWYEDSDGDGYGLETSTMSACEEPAGYVFQAGDCDDDVGAINPDADEICDTFDNNCDGTADEDGASDATTWYADSDGDGYGDSDSSQIACDQPSSTTTDASDCDDEDTHVNPDEAEVCMDGVDNDCDGSSNDCAPSGTLSESSVDAVLTGESENDDAGVSVAFAGDVDGDGYLDLLVGSPGDDEAGGTSGAAQLIYGPVTGTLALTDSSVIRLLGDNSSDETGWSVAGVGDLDDDGWDDFAVGAPNSDGDDYRAGQVYIQYGPVGSNTDLGTSADVTLQGSDVYDNAGASLAGLGDVDGDGYDDMAVGGPGLEGSGVNGSVWVVLGTPSSGENRLNNEAEAHITGQSTDDRTGAVVAAAGDVNGDGYQDMWVTAPNEDEAATDAGAAWLLLGPISGETSIESAAETKLSGIGDDDRAGTALAAGDLNGDGSPDVVISAPGVDYADTDTGSVYVVLSPSSGTHLLSGADAIFSGENASDGAAASLAIGDLDADGNDDLAIGVPNTDDTGSDSGSVYLVYGPLSGEAQLNYADLEIQGNEGDLLGTSLALGDSDGDGYYDLLSGIPGKDDPSSQAGGALLLLGSGL